MRSRTGPTTATRLEPLRFEVPLAVVKRSSGRRTPTSLSRLIRTYLLDNPHRLTVLAEPDPTHNQRLAVEERENLGGCQVRHERRRDSAHH